MSFNGERRLSSSPPPLLTVFLLSSLAPSDLRLDSGSVFLALFKYVLASEASVFALFSDPKFYDIILISSPLLLPYKQLVMFLSSVPFL